MAKQNLKGTVQTLAESAKDGKESFKDSLFTNTPLRDRESINRLWEVINSGISYADILLYIENELKESVRVVDFRYQFKCFFGDGAYAIHRAIQEKFGYARTEGKEGPSGDKPPVLQNIKLSDGTLVKVPFGKINLPHFGDDAFVDMSYDWSTGNLHIKGECQKRYQNEMDDIYERIKTFLDTDSIYRGQAIKFVSGEEPEFISLKDTDSINLFLTPSAKFATIPVEARIEKTQECLAKGMDLKFGVLLEGPYGTGKTAYAFKLASKAVLNDWTFIYVKNAADTLEALEVAGRFDKNGKGVVIFVEDVDKILNKRDSFTNEISLLMDGGETKKSNIITIFSTNHIADIDQTFLRGKRIGSVVSLTAPDAQTAEMMIRSLFEEGDIPLVGDISKVCERIEKMQIVPAFIHEIVDRVKSTMMYADFNEVSEVELSASVDSYVRQIEIAAPKDKKPSKAEVLYTALESVIGDTINVSDVKSDTEEILENI